MHSVIKEPFEHEWPLIVPLKTKVVEKRAIQERDSYMYTTRKLFPTDLNCALLTVWPPTFSRPWIIHAIILIRGAPRFASPCCA